MADVIQECGRLCPGQFTKECQPLFFPSSILDLVFRITMHLQLPLVGLRSIRVPTRFRRLMRTVPQWGILRLNQGYCVAVFLERTGTGTFPISRRPAGR